MINEEYLRIIELALFGKTVEEAAKDFIREAKAEVLQE